MNFQIIPNENWRTGGNWVLMLNGNPVMVEDDRRILMTYAGKLIEATEKSVQFIEQKES